jgi:hypothetical protein
MALGRRSLGVDAIPKPGAVGLRTVNRLDRLESERGKARDVQFTGIVVVVDDEHQRPGSNGARLMAQRMWDFPTGLEIIARKAGSSGRT